MERERRSLCASGVRTKREGTVEGKCQVLVWVGVQKSRMEKGFGMSKVHCNLRPKVLEGLGCSKQEEGRGVEERGVPGHTIRHPGICNAVLWEAPKSGDCLSPGAAAAGAKMKGFPVYSVPRE